ncbi:MAG TPA: DUF72 domain-containing protein [Sphingomicrobium sp.]|jgi:uncharacterized protein YecE (DUF72 family)
MTIRVGIGGWTYPDWRKNFYPDGLPHSKELEYAAAQLGTIEINSTFYGRQKPASWQAWEKTVPDGFQFAIKGSRFCVSRKNIGDGAEGLQNFFAQGFEALGPKLGPILWQFLPRRKFDVDDIARFFDLLPEKLGSLKLRHAIEPRDESFRDDKFFDLCRARNIAVVHEDADDYPLIEADTADFAYARLQRMRSDVPTGYEEPELDRFAKLARKWSRAGRDTYVYLINGAKERAPAAALALQERLR